MEAEKMPDPRRFEEGDIRVEDVRPCAHCGGPLMGREGRHLNLYRVRIESLMVNPAGVREHHAMTELVGHPRIAIALSPGTPAIKRMPSAVEVVVCFDCAMQHAPIMMLEHAREAAGEHPAARS